MRWRRTALQIAAAAAGTAVVFGLSGCAAPVNPTVAGSPVTHLQATLDATLPAFNAWAVSAHVIVDPRARCYVIPNDAAPTIGVWCGPATWPGHADGEFGRYTATLGHRHGTPVLIVDTSRPPAESNLAGVSQLAAPSGYGVSVVPVAGSGAPLYSLVHVAALTPNEKLIIHAIPAALIVLLVSFIVVRGRRRHPQPSSIPARATRARPRWASLLAMADAPARPSTGHPVPTPSPRPPSAVPAAPQQQQPLPGLEHRSPGSITHPWERAPTSAPTIVDDDESLRAQPSVARTTSAPEPSRADSAPVRASPAPSDAHADAAGEDDVLGDEAEEDAQVATGPPQILVLGPVEIVGWPHAPRRRILIEIAAFLALHPGRVWTGDQLRAELWPLGEDGSGKEVNDKTLRSYASYLRQALGPEHVPPSGGTGYQLVGVQTDWGRFQELTRTASPDRRAALTDALALVRGTPFADAAAYSYGWAWGADPLASQMEAAVAAVAFELGELALAADDPRGARWAARQGLRASPYDATLYGTALRAAAASDDPAEVDRVWADSRAALGGSERDLRLGEVYRSLGHR